MQPMPTHPLDGVKQQLEACIKCAACMPVCPTYKEALKESMGPRGRLALAVGLTEGEIGPDAAVARAISSCIDCRACVPACPRRIPLDTVFYLAKAEIARAGGLLTRLLYTVSRLVLVKNRLTAFLPVAAFLAGLYRGISDQSPLARLLPFYRNGKKRRLPELVKRPLTDDYPEVVTPQNVRGRVAFFPGCVINLTSTHIGHATIDALTKLDVEVVIPKQAPCCGIPLLSLGDRAGAREVAKEVIDRYGGLDVDAIVTACASCGTTLRDTYPMLLPGQESDGFAARVQDVTEYITGHTDYAARAGKLDRPVTYHDPCHLVRGMGVTKQPRDILRTIAPEGFREMEGADRCCGFGGLFSALHYDLSLGIGADKAKSVAASGAQTVATGCPGCQMHMNDTLDREAVPARVAHTVELLAEALSPGKTAHK